MKGEIWREVIDAIEAAIPDYDLVNEKVSLGLAMKTREYAVDQLALKNGVLVLDAGIGPGTMSEALLSRTTGLTILGLDASTKLLLAAREKFKSSHNEQVHFVRAVFEAVPVKDASVGGVVSAYAFRDSRDRSTAIDEFHRVIESGGCFAIVDLGKPDNPIKRILVTIYIQYLMPLIAHFAKSNRIRGNPWRMIIPTYKVLITNRELVQSLRRRFGDVKIWEFLLGGVVVILARV